MCVEKNEQQNKDNIDLAYDVMIRKLERFDQANDKLDLKIGILFGFEGVFIGSLFLLLQDDNIIIGWNTFTTGLFLVFGSLIFLTVTARTRIFLDPPDFARFFSVDALALETINLKNNIIADMKASYEKNMIHQEIKAIFFDSALYYFISGIVLIVLGIIIG